MVWEYYLGLQKAAILPLEAAIPKTTFRKMDFCWAVLEVFVWLTTMSYTPRIRFNLDHGGLVQIMFLSFHGWLFTFHVNLPGCVFLLGQYIPTDSVLGAFFQNSQVPASMDKLCKYATPLTVSKKKSAARGSFTIPTSFCDSWVVTETFLYLL